MGLVLLLVYVALSLLSPADLFPALAPYRLMVILAAMMSLVMVIPLFTNAVMAKIPHQFFSMVLFMGFVFASWIPHGWYGGSVMTIEYVAPSIIVYFACVILIKTTRGLDAMRIVLIALAIYTLIMGLIQYPVAKATGHNTAYVLVSLADQEEGINFEPRIRGVGMLGDPNTFGQFLLMLLPILFITGQSQVSRLGCLVTVPIGLLFLLGVFLSGSRGAAVGVIFLLGWKIFQRYRWQGALLSLIPGSIAILLYNSLRSARGINVTGGIDRLNLWSEGLGLFKASPIYGNGYRNFTDRVDMTAHNSFLLCAAELGFVGLFLWICVLVITLVQLGLIVKSPKTAPATRHWASALTLSLVVYLVTSFFLSRLYEMPLYVLLGTAGAVIRMEVERQGRQVWPAGQKWIFQSLGISVGLIVLIWGLVRARFV